MSILVKWRIGDKAKLNWMEKKDEKGERLAPPEPRRDDASQQVDEKRMETPIVSEDEELPSTPLLHVACRHGRVDDVLAALDATASVNAVNTADETPLFIAARWGHTQVVQMLLKKNAHVELGKVNSDMTPLRIAANNGHVDVVRALLAANACMDDVESDDGLTVLYEAARKGHVEVARALLEHGAKLHVPNRNEQAPLYVSARNGHTDVMRLLLEHGDEVDRININGVTPLWIAALKGRVEAVELLLAHGANVDAVDVDGITPLWIAAQEGRTNVVQALLKHGADASATTNKGITPLSASTHNSGSVIIKELIAYGAHVDAVDSDGHTPLYVVCRDGYLSAAKILLANDACVEGAVDAVDGLTPLFVAAQNGYLGIVLALLSHHASVNVRDSDGATPLHAASERGHADIIHVLVVKGCVDKEAASKNGDTALHVAARNGRMDAVKALLKLGAETNSPNKRQETPLYIACENGHVAVAQVLLTKGASAALSAVDGDTPLHAAARDGHVDVVSKLLRRGSTSLLVDVVNSRNATPLFEASGNGHLAVVDVLLSVGAQLGVADEDGNTPLIAASRGGHLSTVLVLINAGASVCTTNTTGETAALAAGSSGHFKIVSELVTRGGASVHARATGVGGETLLTAAARWGDVGAVSFLVEHEVQRDDVKVSKQLSLLPATLQTLCDYGPRMRELKTMWESVVERLYDIHTVFEGQRAEGISSALMYQYLMLVFRVVRLKLVWEKRNLFTRLVASRNTASAFQDFHTELDHLQRCVRATLTATPDGAMAGMTSEWRHEWITDCENLTELFWNIVKDDNQLLPHLSQDADLLEAILLLLYEINAHSNQCTQRKLELLELSVKKLMTRVAPDTVIELPKWFLPHHELNFEHTADSASRTSKPFSGKWLNSSVLICACQLDQVAVVALASRWSQLSHPNVIKIFGVYHLREPFLVVFENAPATSLREYLAAEQQQSHRSSVHFIWRKLYEVALGLKYLHDRGIVLGKLQCDSIWIGTSGLAKIAECGLNSYDLTASDERNEVRWLGAECLEGNLPTPESDIYSLGICIIEAFTGQDPWHGKPITKVISLIRWGLLPSQPSQLSDSQWSLVSRMCSFDPLRRGKLVTIVEHLKQFASTESDDSSQAAVYTTTERHLQQRSSHMMTTLDLAGHVFPELGSSINMFLVKLERKSDLCPDAREYVAHVHARLSNIFAWLQQAHNVASEVAVAKFCQVLVSFDHFLSVAVSQTSVIRQAKSRKVSLSNSVLHREIDELMGFLSMESSVDSIHNWKSSARLSSFDKLLRSLTESESDSVKSEPGGGGVAAGVRSNSGDNDVVKLVQFESKHVNQNFAPVSISSTEAMSHDDAIATPSWFIPLYDLKFRKEDCIGTGAFGEVYRGAWLSTPVVVKMMGYEDDDDSGNAQSIFLHELRVWYPLNHPHVVKLFGACHVGKRFFVCEYAANGTLSSFLARTSNQGDTTATTTTNTWQALYEVALGLQYLHYLTIVHNDLKCDNFLVGADGKVKITDFGLSCIAHTTEIQVNLAKLGAQQWKAPEYLRGERSTLASDVYSLGMCILEAATGTLPWGSMADAFVRRNVHRGVLPKCPSALSARQWNLVELMCANEPTHRLRISTVVERLQEFAQQTAAVTVKQPRE